MLFEDTEEDGLRMGYTPNYIRVAAPRQRGWQPNPNGELNRIDPLGWVHGTWPDVASSYVLAFAFLDLLGWDLPALKLINSFGFFVALAFPGPMPCSVGAEAKPSWAISTLKPSPRGRAQPHRFGMQALMGFVLGGKCSQW